MPQISDMNGARQRTPDSGVKSVVFLGDGSLPFGQADFEQLPPDQQGWLLEGFLCAQDIERFRLGQELHDSIGQLLVVLRLDIARIRQQGVECVSGDLFREIDLTVEQIEKETRAFSFLHYPTQLQDEGLVVTLQNFAKGFGQRTGLNVSFRNQCRAPLGKGPTHAALLRVAQEALTNVYRHAHASAVLISIANRRDNLELCIEDDGQGLPDVRNCRAGVGLRSMSHRMESHGGQLIIRRLNHGTKIIARVPIDRFDLDILSP